MQQLHTQQKRHPANVWTVLRVMGEGEDTRREEDDNWKKNKFI